MVDPETPEGISKTKPKTKESKPQTKETNVFEDSFINDGEDQSESDFDFEVCFFSFKYILYETYMLFMNCIQNTL